MMPLTFFINPYSVSLLTLRIVVGMIFILTGWSYLVKTEENSRSIEMSRSFTFLLGLGEFVSGLFLISGILIRPVAAILMIIMSGAIGFKLFLWETGFLGDKILGWFFDLILLAFNFILFAFGSGGYTIL